MEEIKVGEYVRTNKGIIDEVIKIEESGKGARFFGEKLEDTIVITNGDILSERRIGLRDIIKHSKNIIDLIEIGDIIHTKDVLNEDIVYIWSQEYLEAVKEDINNGIRLVSILTKEQFKQAEYKI